jgi:hypothetical protein
MGPDSSNYRGENTHVLLKLSIATLVGLCASALCAAQDIQQGVTYVCNGEHIYIDGCNIRDLSDTARCTVVHPDHVGPSGIAAITSETRGSLKNRLPACQQPTAKEIAAHQAFEKKQQELYAAAVAKANGQPNPAMAQNAARNMQQQQQPRIVPPKNAEERAMRRCVSSGRLPATCTGNSLLGAFGQMLGQIMPSAAKEPAPGPDIAGVFEGAGHWRLDFVDGGVLVNCSYLSPNEEGYSIDFKSGRAIITVDTRPKPLVLTLRADGTITGPGPVTIDGVVADGSSGGGSTPGHTESHDVTTHERINAYQVNGGNAGQVTNTGGGTYDLATTTTQSTYVPGTSSAPHANFSSRRVTCPALNLSSKGAGVGIQTMQTDLLKSMFSDGEKGPPTPAGIRMHGIFAASTGFSAQFFPESVILGCGPDSARAYPYTVEASGGAIKVAAPDHPLTLSFRPDGSLDAGSGPYVVHGRMVVGTDNNDDFTFAPMEQTCELGVLAPSHQIPSGGGTAATMMASAGNVRVGAPSAGTANAGTPNNSGGRLSTPAAPLGNATLSIMSGLPAQSGVPDALAGRPYVLLRDSYANALAKGGVSVPAGMSPYMYVANTCGAGRTPECQKIMDAVNANAASAVRADANGRGTLPGVAPGTYYLMVSARYNNQGFAWGQAVQLKAGQNSVALDMRNATPIK